jgi:hypothetical protein
MAPKKLLNTGLQARNAARPIYLMLAWPAAPLNKWHS